MCHPVCDLLLIKSGGDSLCPYADLCAPDFMSFEKQDGLNWELYIIDIYSRIYYHHGWKMKEELKKKH
jgi:hypothetical protein